eukprot:TRINITY_DN44552_c0_g1_i1.p1 TRINITY_DN44552_c0_g1~~TRINITY_DN44552_c0_g1_i1.p1  ORF type:complete len:1419 (+),score=306.55 TRINITY_DN44552_c0_g1_i1:151-4407(+)
MTSPSSGPGAALRRPGSHAFGPSSSSLDLQTSAEFHDLTISERGGEGGGIGDATAADFGAAGTESRPLADLSSQQTMAASLRGSPQSYSIHEDQVAGGKSLGRLMQDAEASVRAMEKRRRVALPIVRPAVKLLAPKTTTTPALRGGRPEGKAAAAKDKADPTVPGAAAPKMQVDAKCLAMRPGFSAGFVLIGDSQGCVSLWDAHEEESMQKLDVEEVKSTSSSERFRSEAIGSHIVTACWSPSGSTFAAAAASEAGQAGKERQAVVVVWSVYDDQEGLRRPQVCELKRIRLDRKVQAMCFCSDGDDSGCHIAVVEDSEFLPTVVVYNIDTPRRDRPHKMRTVVLPLKAQCLAFVGGLTSSGPSRGGCALTRHRPPQLAIGVGDRVMLWSYGCEDSVYWDPESGPFGDSLLDVHYDTHELKTLSEDFELCPEGPEVVEVNGGPPARCGVQGGRGWLLLGWRDTSGGLQVAKNREGLGTLSENHTKAVTLVFQRPQASASFEQDGKTLCLAVSPDGSYLAIGGQDTSTTLSTQRRLTKAAASLSGATLALWSLDMKYCSQQLRLHGDVRSLAWVGDAELLVAHQKDVILVNTSSGGIARTWGFQFLVECVAATPTRSLMALQIREQGRHSKKGFQLCSLDLWDSEVVVPLPKESEAGHHPRRTLVSCSGDGNIVATRIATKDKHWLKLWQFNSHGLEAPPLELLQHLHVPEKGRKVEVEALALSESGDFLAVCVLSKKEMGIGNEVHSVQVFGTKPVESVAVMEHRYGEVTAAILRSNNLGGGLVFAGVGGSKAFVAWHSSGGRERTMTQVALPAEVKYAAVALSPNGGWLATASAPERTHAGMKIWNTGTRGQVSEVLNIHVSLPVSVRCLAFGAEHPPHSHADHARKEAAVALHAVRAGSNVGEDLPQLLACGYHESPDIRVYDMATGVPRCTLSAETQSLPVHNSKHGHEEDRGPSRTGISTLAFTDTGVLAAGSPHGTLAIFGLAPGGGDSKMLYLSGEVHGVALAAKSGSGARMLSRAICLGESRSSIVMYNLVSPSLSFLLPDLRQLAHEPEKFHGQLSVLPALLNQKIQRRQLQWNLLHWVAWRGLNGHVRSLMQLRVSPLSLDAFGRNAMDVALQYHHPGVVEEILRWLIEEASQSGQAKGGVQTTMTRGSPEEHSALTRTVVNLMGKHISALPEFIDIGCSGPPLVQHDSPRPPSRMALQSGELRLAAATTPVYRCTEDHCDPLAGLVPSVGRAHWERHRRRQHVGGCLSRALRGCGRGCWQARHKVANAASSAHRQLFDHDEEDLYRDEDAGASSTGAAAERPAEVRVWYLRGALDAETDMVSVLMAAQEQEVLRTRFASAVLTYKWRAFARRHFLWQFAGFACYLVVFSIFLSWSPHVVGHRADEDHWRIAAELSLERGKSRATSGRRE